MVLTRANPTTTCSSDVSMRRHSASMRARPRSSSGATPLARSDDACATVVTEESGGGRRQLHSRIVPRCNCRSARRWLRDGHHARQTPRMVGDAVALRDPRWGCRTRRRAGRVALPIAAAGYAFSLAPERQAEFHSLARPRTVPGSFSNVDPAVRKDWTAGGAKFENRRRGDQMDRSSKAKQSLTEAMWRPDIEQRPALDADVTFGAPVILDGPQANRLLRDIVAYVPRDVLARHLLPLGAPIYWLNGAERQEERRRILEEMLANKAALIELLKRRLARASNEDEREAAANELYGWLAEDERERMQGLAETGPVPAPTGGHGVVAENKQRWNTEENVRRLAIVIMSEASVGNQAERTAVAYTVLNRMQRNNTNSVDDVDNAYSRSQSPYEPPRNDAIIRLAADILRCAIADNTGGATHFYSPRSSKKEGDENDSDFVHQDTRGGLEQTPDVPRRNYRPGWSTTFERRAVDGVRESHYKFYRAPGDGRVQ